jgi:acetate---CoA ligase (ADP-forming)
MTPAKRPLSVLVAPKSVAVLGASDNPARIGGRPLGYMLAAKFDGPIYPVNPNRDTVQGLKAYASLADLPGPVDAAVVAVPAKLVVGEVEQCARMGIGACVIFSSGFAEAGEEGLAWQRRLGEIAAESGMRILGPNCLGTFNAQSGFIATFSSSVEHHLPSPGPLAIASQSGAYGSHVFALARERGLETSYWITTGNEADVELSECIAWLVDAPEVNVIVCYAEAIRNGPGLRDALAKARAAGKPVVFMKVGRSEIGAAAAASHTAALAVPDAIVDGLFQQYGVHRAETTIEMLDVAYACRHGRFPTGRRLGLMTISGGVGVQMADAAADLGLDVAALPEPAQRKMLDLLPFCAPRNPVDITGQALNDVSLIAKGMQVMMEDGGFDAVVAFFTMVASSRYVADDLIATLSGARARFPDRLMFLSIIAPPEIRRLYEEQGYPIYSDPIPAVGAAAALMRFGAAFRDGAGVPPPALPPGALPIPDLALAEHEAKAVLASAGLPVVDERLCTTADAAVAAWRLLAGPVAMKLASPDILHKTEIGGVVLGVDGADAVRAAFGRLTDAARTHQPAARLDGILVAPMIGDGVETVIGVTDDPTFGPVVMFGLGGILVEVLEDVAFRLAPFGVDEARRMIDGIRGRKVLDGVRGRPPADIDALADALARVSVFAAANAGRFQSIDINPFIVRPQGAVAVDALIVPRRAGDSS